MWVIVIFAIFLAILITAIFSFGFRNTGPWGSIWIFFAIIFLVALVAGEWATPVGPAVYGLYWVPIVFITLIVAFIIAAATPTPGGMRPRRYRRFDSGKIRTEDEDDITTDDEGTAAISVFVYIILVLLIIAAIAGFFR